jgi:hypothetical protein
MIIKWIASVGIAFAHPSCDMKITLISATKVALVCTALAGALFTFSDSASAVGISDNHEFALVQFGATSRHGEPSTYVNHLIGMARPAPQAVLANHMNTGNAGDLRGVIPVYRPVMLPRLGGAPGGTAVPDGGITAMLLGTALGVLGIARRYIMS